MGYLAKEERDRRLEAVRAILAAKDLDLALVYYDEFNIGNGWYLTGWCPQFESGCVLVPRAGEPMILGGPESEPFAKQDSAITETRNLPCFMVPDEEYPNAVIGSWPKLFAEISAGRKIRRAGIVGAQRMPAGIRAQIGEAFAGVELVDITGDYEALRAIKSEWEREMIRKAFQITDGAIAAMKAAVKPGVREIEVAAEGEYAARKAGASGFGFTAIVGSGPRSNAVVPTASSRVIQRGESVMLGIAPKWFGYAGVAGATVFAGQATEKQRAFLRNLSKTFALTKAMLLPGKKGKEVDAPGRKFYDELGWTKYIVCPFAHTIGLHEAEGPFFGPHSSDELKPGMTVCIDVSFFGHPEFFGARIETGYEITASGPKPLSPAMDKYLCEEIGR
ncbi:MAG TPA: Xaa-Pro peptidase family protein [Candidatus Brocadiia bacterium]|nr:Xaa-Pro peptidase family protein [Candidatus Brocadiia bacterium]